MEGWNTRIKLWDKENKEMLPSFPLYKSNFFECDTGRYVLRFSTGLKDKKGIEIYEGDIIGYLSPSGFAIKNGSLKIVKYDNGGFSPFAIPGWEINPEPEEIEIVGNIYENPKLIRTIIAN